MKKRIGSVCVHATDTYELLLLLNLDKILSLLKWIYLWPLSEVINKY